MPKKETTAAYERSLYQEIGNLREVADRVSSVLYLVDHVESLIEAIEENNPNVLLIAGVVKGSLEKAKKAIS